MPGDIDLGQVTEQVIATAIVVAVMVLVRWVAAGVIRRGLWSTAEEGRRWLVIVRNTTLIVGAVALVLVWSEQLTAAALSLVAFAVALVFAGTEILKALSASLIRANSRAFAVGDRIQVGSIRGEVIDATLTTTTVLEIGKTHVRTGRTVSIPNALFLSEPVVNETRGHRYVLHSFGVEVATDRWREARRVLLEAAESASAPYIDEARRSMEARAREHALPMPIVEPFVMAKPTPGDGVELTVRVPVSSADAWLVEDTITATWLEQLS